MIVYLFVLTLKCVLFMYLRIEFLNLEPNACDKLRLLFDAFAPIICINHLHQSFARFKAVEILERRDASDKHKQTFIIKYYLLIV